MRRQRCACRPRSARASTRGAGEEQQPAQIVLGARNFNLSNVTEAWPTLACLCLHIGTFGSCGGVGEQGFENFGGGQPLAGASESTEKWRRTTVLSLRPAAHAAASADNNRSHSPP